MGSWVDGFGQHKCNLCGTTLPGNKMLTQKRGSFAEDKIHKSKVCLYMSFYSKPTVYMQEYIMHI